MIGAQRGENHTPSAATVPFEAFDVSHPDHADWVADVGRCFAKHDHADWVRQGCPLKDSDE